VAGIERKESQSLDVEISRFRSARGVVLRSTLGELGAHKTQRQEVVKQDQ
jgi:hypothetical protein